MMSRLTRRALLASAAALSACAGPELSSLPPPGAPLPVHPAGWKFFSPEQAILVEAAVDRLIPADDLSPGGRDAGCALFIDRQLAGPYGNADGLYMRPPFHEGLPGQGSQSALTPAARYRAALPALDAACRAAYLGRDFAQLDADQQDRVLAGLEQGQFALAGTDGRAFFELLLRNTMEGFFADPVYGGNRDMAGWRMIGFPGTRYDYRDWVARHGERYPLPPVGLTGSPAWTPGRA